MNETVRSLEPRPPTEITVHAAEMQVGFTPRELRLIKEKFGRSFTQLVGDEETDDKMVAIGWLNLRRQGHDVDLDQMDDIVIHLDATGVDPTRSGPPSSSPTSAGSGG